MRDWALGFHCCWGVFAFSRVKKNICMYLNLHIVRNIHICTDIHIFIDILVRNHKFLLRQLQYIHMFLNLSLIPYDPFFYSKNQSSQKLIYLCIFTLLLNPIIYLTEFCYFTHTSTINKVSKKEFKNSLQFFPNYTHYSIQDRT